MPNFVIQDGDPRGDGCGGPGGAIRDEINRRRYDAPILGMALSGPDTGSSQWFITHSPAASSRRDLHRVRAGGQRQRRAQENHPGRVSASTPSDDDQSLFAAALLRPLLRWPHPPAGGPVRSFGQNKIQYRKFDWRVLKGPHVDLYYYPAEEQLAPVALAYAEQSYDTLALQFGHEVKDRIPLIVYASHSDFEQTNILPFVPPEGLLGVTDFLKRRVTLPFRGNLVGVPPHAAARDGARVSARAAALEGYYKSARGQAVPDSALVDRRGWPSSGREGRSRATR